MSRTSSVVAGAVVVVGVFALALLPIGRLLLMWTCLGMSALTVLLVVDGVAILGRSLSPLRAVAWFKKPQADEPGVAMRVVTMETAIAAVAVVVLAASARWWQPLLGVAVPIWIVALLAVRNAALTTMGALAGLKRPLAAVALLVDVVAIVPLAALLTRSFSGTVIASTAASCVFAAVAVRSGTSTHVEREKKLDAREPAADEVRDPWLLGNWLQTIQNNLRRPVLVVVGGAMLAVPLSAALTLSSLLVMPFMTVAATKPARSVVYRVLRGVLCAAGGVWFIDAVGPAIYRAAFPDAFGDGAWLHVLAWCSLAAIPIAIRGDSTKASQLRVGIAAVIVIALLFGLGMTYGLVGVLSAIALGSVLCSLIGMTVEKSDPLAWD